MNEIVFGSKQFKKYRQLSGTIIDKSKLYDCFMKRFNELIERLNFHVNFMNMLFLNYLLKSLENEVFFTNTLGHLLFWSRSLNSNERQCKLCSQLYVMDANEFVLSICNIIFLGDLQIIKFSVMKLKYYLLNREE